LNRPGEFTHLLRAGQVLSGAHVTTVPRWFDRKFEFTFPVEQLPNLCARLRGTPARLEEMFRGSSRDVRVRKTEGKWSAQEHAGHLLDLETLWVQRVEDFVSSKSELTAADLSNRKTDDANHNARQIEDILAAFRTERVRLVDRVAGIDSAAVNKAILHPRLKQPMRLVDHLYFAAEHDDHHLASIWELLHAK
jgi:uncharacterized damage-inducible protein DinB